MPPLRSQSLSMSSKEAEGEVVEEAVLPHPAVRVVVPAHHHHHLPAAAADLSPLLLRLLRHIHHPVLAALGPAPMAMLAATPLVLLQAAPSLEPHTVSRLILNTGQ